MEFFGIGFLEILVILVIALVVVGPGRIVEVARTLGKITRALKKASYDLTAQITREMDEENKEKKHPPARQG